MKNKKFNLKLEQYILNENSEDLKYDELDIESREYIDMANKDNEDFFKKFDISQLAESTQKRASKRKIISLPSRQTTILTAAAACFVIVLNLVRGPVTQEEIYLKGEQQINIYLKENGEIEKLKNLDEVTIRDQIQITYRVNNSYGVIFSVDGLNNITFHYPDNPNSSTELDIGKEITLPSSYTLDNAPYFEKFYIVTAESKFDYKFVRESIDAIEVKDGKIVNDLILPPKYKINTTVLLKE